MLDNVAFHNVAELESRTYLSGLKLQRFPKQVRESLTEKGRTKAAESSGCEIRFVTEASNIRVTMAAQEKDGRVLVFKGDLFHAAYDLKAGVVTLYNWKHQKDLLRYRLRYWILSRSLQTCGGSIATGLQRSFMT
jgi:hypothetical protein